MGLSSFSLAAFAVISVALPARAEMIVISSDSRAAIESHNASSHFLKGAFLAVPSDWNDNFDNPSMQPGQSPDPGNETSNITEVEPIANLLPAQTAKGLVIAPEPATLSDPQGSDEDTRGVAIGPIGGGPGTVVGTVPLPATMPMFGLALLAVFAIGRAVRFGKREMSA